MKNANGTGSVYKLNGKRRKPWICVFTTHYTLDGKQKRKMIGTFATKKEAMNKLLEYNKNPYLLNSYNFKDISFKWLEENKSVWSEKTFSNYRKIVNKLFSFYERKINELTIQELQSFISTSDSSYNYKKNIKSVLSMIYNYCVKAGFVTSNNINLLTIGKKEVVIERKVFTDKEIKELFEMIQPTSNINIPACLVILIYTGLRAGELLALKKENINLKERYLKVDESKTEAGKRIIPISNKIINVIKMLMESNDKEYLITSDSSYDMIKYNSLRRAFGVFIKKYNMDHTIHDTRHTFATLLSNANANSTAVKKIIGHTSFELTESVYIHKNLKELTKAIDLI